MAKYICFIYKITRHKYHNKKRKLATNEINKQYINNVIWCVSETENLSLRQLLEKKTRANYSSAGE